MDRLYDVDPQVFPGAPPRLRAPELYALAFRRRAEVDSDLDRLAALTAFDEAKFMEVEQTFAHCTEVCDRVWAAMTEAEKTETLRTCS